MFEKAISLDNSDFRRESEVYDISGKKITSLIDRDLSAGNYAVDFEGTDYSSGIYFYTIEAGEFTDTKRMILIK